MIAPCCLWFVVVADLVLAIRLFLVLGVLLVQDTSACCLWLLC